MRARQTAVAARTIDEIEADADETDSAEAERSTEIDGSAGFSRYRDPVTQSLGLLASEWESMHKAWQAAAGRARIASSSRCAAALEVYRDELRALRDGDRAKLLERELRAHVLYPWLKSHRGCPKSVHTARLISMIGDPLRFPGRQCERCGGYFASDHEGPCNQSVRGEPGKTVEGSSAEKTLESETTSGSWSFCGGNVGPLRPGTGTRALWHYFGLHVVNGKRPRHQRGQQSDWKDEAYTALLQPDGIADMVIRQKCEPWYGMYVETKERVCRERGVEQNAEGERSGDAETYAAEQSNAIDSSSGSEACGAKKGRTRVARLAVIDGASGPQFTRMHAHKIGRVVLAKAFVADLLAEWKRLVTGSQ